MSALKDQRIFPDEVGHEQGAGCHCRAVANNDASCAGYDEVEAISLLFRGGGRNGHRSVNLLRADGDRIEERGAVVAHRKSFDDARRRRASTGALGASGHEGERAGRSDGGASGHGLRGTRGLAFDLDDRAAGVLGCASEM